jgi:hypothetical protein
MNLCGSDGPLIVLTAGVVAPIEALELLWSLEARGLYVTLEGDVLAVGPRHQITDADREAIRQYREHLQAVVSCEREQ